jgi:hypothetical protein
MEKICKRCLSFWLVAVLLLFLAGCTMPVTKHISDKLDMEAINKNYGIKPIDLSSGSKCAGAPAVKIVNMESRTDDYPSFKNPPYKGFISPKEMMDSVSLYLKNGFEKNGIKGDDQSTKVLQLKMIDLQSVAGVWSFGGSFKMELQIPEKNITKTYEATENAGNGFSAAAYAIHGACRKVIDDPVAREYILCK